ncbi:MAG: hypothetical protein FWH48_11430, partial [Oscillospiraceae bacterium]|nr:hypothetical protein [Oscillospiraceae bacterium]
MKSRWAYLAKADKKGFVSSIHIISLAALLQYLLFRELPGLVFSAFGFFVNELGILDSDFFRFWPPEELGYLFFNLMSLVTTLVACGATAAFVVFCEKKFAPENRPATDRVSYRFKLP